MMEKKRFGVVDDGITAVAIVFLLPAVIAGLVAPLGFISSLGPNETVNDRFVAIGIASIIAIILAFSGIGLLLRKSWSRLVAIVTAIISLLGLSFLIVKSLSNNDVEDTILPFMFILAFISAIYYLTRPKIKEQFRK